MRAPPLALLALPALLVSGPAQAQHYDDTDTYREALEASVWVNEGFATHSIGFDVSRDAHVAIFEMVFGGAPFLIYPEFGSSSYQMRAGARTVFLDRRTHRSRSRLGHFASFSRGFSPFGRGVSQPRFILLVASEAPLDVSRFLASRDLGFGLMHLAGGGTSRQMEAVVSEVVPSPSTTEYTTAWTVIWPNQRLTETQLVAVRCPGLGVFYIPLRVAYVYQCPAPPDDGKQADPAEVDEPAAIPGTTVAIPLVGPDGKPIGESYPLPPRRDWLVRPPAIEGSDARVGAPLVPASPVTEPGRVTALPGLEGEQGLAPAEPAIERRPGADQPFRPTPERSLDERRPLRPGSFITSRSVPITEREMERVRSQHLMRERMRTPSTARFREDLAVRDFDRAYAPIRRPISERLQERARQTQHRAVVERGAAWRLPSFGPSGRGIDRRAIERARRGASGSAVQSRRPQPPKVRAPARPPKVSRPAVSKPASSGGKPSRGGVKKKIKH